ncbi:MAG: nucleotide exchange factor GrpE [Candidatus Heimdallarchaeota archaeon]|nr:MAG: nucleotide exchange factor GrpE [Candidatus Heimdallarchaeota archaeon]
MNQKSPSNSNENEEEIIDIDYQIEKADVETPQKAENNEETVSSLTEGSANKELFEELERIYKELEEKDELYDKAQQNYMRALADYENLEKRTRMERAEIVKQANEKLLLKLVDLADSFEKAEAELSANKSETLDSIVEGFQAVHKQFKGILKNEGVERIPAIGEKFDPNFHEVVFVKPDSNTEDDIILEEVQIGYLLNSKVLRPTKVVVAKTKTEGE